MHHPTDRITHTTAFVTPVVEHWLEREIAQWVRITRTCISGNTYSVFMLIYVFMLIRAPVMYIMYLFDVLLLHIVMCLSVTE